jgi:hypothetical protein
MTSRELLLREISVTPEPILVEVYHYLQFLKALPEGDRFNGLAVSESALVKDWNTPEEDAAWANL